MFDFLPHQFNPFTDQDLRLYHVYDDLSQTPYRCGCGIQSGDANVYLMRYCTRITIEALAKHLDWYQNEPTSFISLYGDKASALREAHRRTVEHPQIFDRNTGSRRYRGSTRIAVVSAMRLPREGVFVFSTQDLMSERMLNLNGSSVVNHQLQDRLNIREWFAMDWIPDEAIERVIHY